MSRKRSADNGSYYLPLPKNLRELRDKSREDQSVLAELLGLSRQAISNYENGISSPDWQQIALIAKHYNVSSDYLLGISETKSRNPMIQDAVSLTGLSEDAIDALCGYVADADFERRQLSDPCAKAPADDAIEILSSFISSLDLDDLLTCLIRLRNAVNILSFVPEDNQSKDSYSMFNESLEFGRKIEAAEYELYKSSRVFEELVKGIVNYDSLLDRAVASKRVWDKAWLQKKIEEQEGK